MALKLSSGGWKSPALRRLLVEEGSSEGFQRKEESYGKSFYGLREYRHCHEENAAGNTSVKGVSCEISDKNEDCVIGKGKKDDLCYKAQRSRLNCVLLGGKQKLQLVNLDVGIPRIVWVQFQTAAIKQTWQ